MFNAAESPLSLLRDIYPRAIALRCGFLRGSSRPAPLACSECRDYRFFHLSSTSDSDCPSENDRGHASSNSRFLGPASSVACPERDHERPSRTFPRFQHRAPSASRSFFRVPVNVVRAAPPLARAVLRIMPRLIAATSDRCHPSYRRPAP